MDINLNNVQHEPIVVAASLTAALNRYYVNTASTTYTDPTPVQGEGFIVYVKNGTATVGGTGYSTVGSVIYRYYHSGAWGNTVLVDPSGSYQPLDADLTSIAGLTSTSAYLRRSASNTYVLDSYSTVASNLPSTGITSKVLTGGTFSGILNATDTILQAFETIDYNLDILTPAVLIDSAFYTQAEGQIIVGDSLGKAQKVALSLNATGGTFGLSGAGVLTMPDADAATRGLLTSSKYTDFQTAYTNRITSLTVTGSSGAATLSSNTLNIPTYTLSGLGGTTLATVNAQNLSVFAATTSAQLRGVLSDENGTGVALFDGATSPSFTTDIRVTKIIGGTGTSDKITNVATTNATTTSTNVGHEWYIGNSGSTLAATILQSGNMGLGSTYSQTVGTFDVSSSRQFKVTNTGGIARVTIDSSSFALLDLNNSANTANQRWLNLANFSNVWQMRSFTDAGSLSQTFLYGDMSNGNLGVGLTTTASARLEVRHTTEQLRLSYDASNRFTTTVSSAGAVTFDAVGASAGFTFSDPIAISNTVNSVSPTSPNRTITMVVNGTTYYIHAKTTND